MSSLEIVFLLTLISAVWYWFDGLRARELAVKTGSNLCQRQGVSFLDESVALVKLRLRRNKAGQVVFYREYGFEFTSDGAHRYRGKIILMGKYVDSTEMDAYRENTNNEIW